MLKRDVTPGTGARMPVPGLHETAIHLASKGFAVFPLRRNMKKGFSDNAAREATTDLPVVREWWNNEPCANIGMATAGYLVLDIDIKAGINGFDSLKGLESVNGCLPRTLTQTTPSGGMHYIFRNSTGKHIPSRMNCPAPGIDVRGNGGYIVVAPSTIDGTPYATDNYSIADAPGWLPDLIDRMPSNLDMVEGSIKGNSRKAFLFGVARECGLHGMTSKRTEERILIANAKCYPAFEGKELENFLEIAMRQAGV